MNTELSSFFGQVARKVRTDVGIAPSAPGSVPPAEIGVTEVLKTANFSGAGTANLEI